MKDMERACAAPSGCTSGRSARVVCEVFGLDRTADGLPGYRFAVCSEQPGMVETGAGFRVEVTEGLDRLATADLIAVPAWAAAELPPPPAVVDALRRAVDRGARVLTVCFPAPSCSRRPACSTAGAPPRTGGMPTTWRRAARR